MPGVLTVFNGALRETLLTPNSAIASGADEGGSCSRGSVCKFFSQEQFHITVRPDGSVVLFRDSAREYCK